MRTLVEFAWTVHSASALINALEAATLVGIDIEHLVFLSDEYYERALHLRITSIELFYDSFFRRIDRCGGYIAVQHNNDSELIAHIDYARKHGIPTAVWQL